MLFLLELFKIQKYNFQAKEIIITHREQHKELADYLSEKVNILVESGAEVIALTAATMHIVFDEIENNTNGEQIVWQFLTKTAALT